MYHSLCFYNLTVDGAHFRAGAVKVRVDVTLRGKGGVGGPSGITRR